MSDHLDHLRLRDLMLLEQVQRLGTLRQVAQALHVTQPAVTQMLRGLEQAFGVALVARGRRGVALTPAGAAALERLLCAHHEIEQARQAAAAHDRPLLRLGVTPLATLRLLPQAIGRLRRRLPQARVVLSETGVAALWRQLAQGEIDALVGRLPTPQPVADGLRHVSVGRERMVLVASDRHPLRRDPPPPRSQRVWRQRLASCDWVLPPGESQAVHSLREWLAQAGEQLPVPVVSSGSFHASLHMVAQAELVTVVPHSAAQTLCGGLGLGVLQAPWPGPPVDIVFAAREAQWGLPAMVALRGCFKAVPGA